MKKYTMQHTDQNSEDVNTLSIDTIGEDLASYGWQFQIFNFSEEGEEFRFIATNFLLPDTEIAVKMGIRILGPVVSVATIGLFENIDPSFLPYFMRANGTMYLGKFFLSEPEDFEVPFEGETKISIDYLSDIPVNSYHKELLSEHIDALTTQISEFLEDTKSLIK